METYYKDKYKYYKQKYLRQKQIGGMDLNTWHIQRDYVLKLKLPTLGVDNRATIITLLEEYRDDLDPDDICCEILEDKYPLDYRYTNNTNARKMCDNVNHKSTKTINRQCEEYLQELNKEMTESGGDGCMIKTWQAKNTKKFNQLHSILKNYHYKIEDRGLILDTKPKPNYLYFFSGLRGSKKIISEYIWQKQKGHTISFPKMLISTSIRPSVAFRFANTKCNQNFTILVFRYPTHIYDTKFPGISMVTNPDETQDNTDVKRIGEAEVLFALDKNTSFNIIDVRQLGASEYNRGFSNLWGGSNKRKIDSTWNSAKKKLKTCHAFCQQINHYRVFLLEPNWN